jgi:hypothetical protein
MIHPTDVFITAANLLSTMGKDYLGSINDQIDGLLEQANMADTIVLNLSEYVGEGTPIDTLNIYLDINSELPFDVTISANFINANGDSISSIVNSNDFGESLFLPFGKGDKTLLDEIRGVAFSVKVSRGEAKIDEGILRRLSQRTISFSLRVNVQAPIKLKL